MKWGDVDLKAATWTIPAAQFKARRPMTVVLSDEALKVLKRRKKFAAGDYVFPSHGKGRPPG